MFRFCIDAALARVRTLLCVLSSVLVWLSPAGIAAPPEQTLFVVPQSNEYVYVNLIIPYDATRPGLAHYVEHLVYLTSIDDRFGKTDPDSNAQTFPYAISYQLSGRARELQEILQALAGVFRPLDLTLRAAEDERKIVLREYDLSHADNIRQQAMDALNAFLYAGNGKAFSLMASGSDIAGFTLEDAQRFHETSHRPEGAILLISGDVTEETVRTDLANSSFPVLSPRSALKPVTITMAAPAESRVSFPGRTVPTLYWNRLVELPQPVPFDRLDGLCARLESILKSGLAGSIAGPLYYDRMVARELTIRVMAVDESHVEVWIAAEPDLNQSFATLRRGLEDALAAAAGGIPEASFARVSKRVVLDEVPQNPAATGPKWSVAYMTRRLLLHRVPLDDGALRDIDRQISLAEVDGLLKAIVTAPGRLAIAELGGHEQR